MTTSAFDVFMRWFLGCVLILVSPLWLPIFIPYQIGKYVETKVTD